MSAIHRTAAWRKLITEVRPIYRAAIKAGTGRCGRCGKPVLPGQKFDVGHIDPHGPLTRANVRLEHAYCNRAAGGRQGAATTNAKRTKSKGFPAW